MKQRMRRCQRGLILLRLLPLGGIGALLILSIPTLGQEKPTPLPKTAEADGNKQDRPPQSRSAELEKWWTDLASQDTGTAYRAVRHFIQAEKRSVEFLRGKVRPVAPIKPERIPQLIQELKSHQETVKQAARRELEQLADVAEVPLRRILQASNDRKLRKTVTEELHQIENRKPSLEELRMLRSVEVLETIASTDAQKLLEKLSAGEPAARFTKEANSALRRLQQLTPSPQQNLKTENPVPKKSPEESPKTEKATPKKAPASKAMRFSGHSDTVTSLVFCRRGTTLISAGLDNQICVWKVATGELIRRVACHRQGIYILALSPDGNTLADRKS